MRALRLFAALGLAVLYIWGLAPSVHIHDAGELTVAAWTLGIGHPPGAPLYMILLKVFMLLVPLGSIAWRANLFSAACAIAAFFLFEALARRLTKNSWVSLGGALAFSLSLTFWSQAEMAEVYTLQAALLLGFLLAYARASELGKGMALPAFMWGMLLACHMGLSPLTPLILILISKPEKPELVAWAKGALRLVPPLSLPLLLYAYLPLRSIANPPVDWGNPENLQNFIWHFTNRQVRGRMLSLEPEMYLSRAWDYLEIVLRNANVLVLLAAIGIWASWKRDRRLLLLLLLVLAADAGFVVLMDTAPLASEAYAIPSVLVLLILAALGSAALSPLPLKVVGVLLLFVGAADFISMNLHEVDLHKNFLVRDAAESLLQETPRGAALFIQEDNTTNPLAYLVFAEGARRDLEIYDRFGNFFHSVYDRPLFLVRGEQLHEYRKSHEEPAVVSLLTAGRPVCFSTPFLDYAPGAFSLLPRDYSAAASSPGIGRPPWETPAARYPRVGEWPDWMSRQIMADLALKRAMAAIDAGDKEAAIQYLREAEGLSDIAEMFLLIGQMARAAGDPQLAIKALDEAIERNPGMAAAMSLKGDILARGARPEEAQKILEKAAEEGPELPQPHALLGIQAAKRGEWQKARDCFTRSLKIDPRQPDLLYDRALAALAMGDRPAAIEDIRASLALNPHNCGAGIRLVALLLDSGDAAEASEVLCALCGEFQTPQLKPEELKNLLLLSAKAGFPPCVGGWLASEPMPAGETKKIAEGYLGAERKVKGDQQR